MGSILQEPEVKPVFEPSLKKNCISLDNKADSFSLAVGSLRLHGFISIHGVANFLNVPYASIPARFKTAISLDPTVMHGDLDVTQYGPRCPQGPDDIHVIMHNMFEKQSMSQYQSEMDCLHLNIYAPPESLESQTAKLLPVFAYIHGGAFNCGDNTTEFDGNHLVKRSMQLGKPIIVVTINYRLNAFGFLSSRELVEEAEAVGEIPILNQGLNDQALALNWIRANIHHFHGDGDQITVSGESAGGASIWFLLHSKMPLFNQAIIQSSPNPTPSPLRKVQLVFDKLVEVTGTAITAPYQVKLSALRSLSSAQLMAHFDFTSPSMPIMDPNWLADFDASTVGTTEYWATLPSWCQKLVVGHTKDEAALFFATSLTDVSANDTRVILRSLDPSPQSSALISSRLIQSAPSPFHALTAYGTQLLFARPTMQLAEAVIKQRKRIWVYEITVPDPFLGPLQGFAWHSMGVPIMFYQPACRRKTEFSSTADRMSEIYTDFIYGKDPWEEFGLRRRKWIWNGDDSAMSETSYIDELEEVFSKEPKAKMAYEVSAAKLLMALFRPQRLQGQNEDEENGHKGECVE